MKKPTLRIGTRGSQLALFQANTVADALKARHPHVAVEIVEILTSGDWRPAHGEARLSESQGGKGLFAKEIEQAILAGTVDCGVHSAKDMASVLPPGLALDHMLPREDVRDAFLANSCESLDALPPGAVVGTASLRRQAFILARRPDLKIVPLRGNVPTRIEKLRAGMVDATILALAGLRRLDLAHEAAAILSPEEMLPAAGQGAIAVETRSNDTQTRTLLDALHCTQTGYCVAAERAALQILDGSCRTPIGAHAVMEGDILTLRVTIASPDGRAEYSETMSGPAANAAQIGRETGQIMKSRTPAALLASC